MIRILTQGVTFLAALLFVAGAYAASSGDDAAIPKASTERFLGNVPSFAGGQPSPSIIYPTGALGAVENGPAKSGSPSVTVVGSPPGNAAPLSSRRLQGGTIEKKTLERRHVESPWR